MKHLEKVGNLPVVESYLFPNSKINAFKNMEGTVDINIGSFRRCCRRRNIAREKINIHLLESTKPNLLLKRIFQPFLFIVSILGNQPLKMHPDGSTSFKYFSWNAAYSALIFGVFVFDTAYFLPIMKYMNSEREANVLVYFTEIILVLSQIFSALVSYIFVAVKAKEIACFWNRLQMVIVKLVARCPNHLDLVPSYRSARMKIVIWLMFTIVFGACYISSFHDEITNYLSEHQYDTVSHWFLFTSFAGYSVILSLHILHSTGFTTFVCVLVSCFRTLGTITLRQDGQGSMKNSQSRLLFHEVIEIYEELVDLKCLLGRIYGMYMALEILAMIICVTINFYFMISNMGVSSLFFLNVAIAMPYVVWFHGICVTCGGLNRMVSLILSQIYIIGVISLSFFFYFT